MAENYAIITVGGKQYVVHEGERFLVERLDQDEGKTFHPEVLFLGGGGTAELAPSATVIAKVVGHVRGPKVRIGKYRPKTGYKRHTGFRSALTRVEITTIGKKTASRATEKIEETPAATAPKGLPKGYEDMTVADVSEGVKSWSRPLLEAALQYEQQHANRKGAIAALEHALAAKEGP